jgi:hypothetical protein
MHHRSRHVPSCHARGQQPVEDIEILRGRKPGSGTESLVETAESS